MPDHQLLLCTCPDDASAEAIAGALVSRRLAACVNIVTGLRSVYVWDDEVQNDAERLLLIKSRADRYGELERTIVDMHPYELPEIIAVPIQMGLAPYLTWIDDTLENKNA